MTGPETIEPAGPGIRVIVLPADLDRQLADRLRPAVAAAAGSGRHLVIDMRHAQHIDSAGLGLLVRAHRSARRRGATVSLVAPSRFVLTVFHTMRLDGVFPVFPDRTTALAQLTQSAARHVDGVRTQTVTRALTADHRWAVGAPSRSMAKG